MSKKRGKKNSVKSSQSKAKLRTKDRLIAKILAKIRFSLNLNTLFAVSTQEVRQLLSVDRVAIYRFCEDWSGEFIIDSVSDGWVSLIHQQSEHPDLKEHIRECSLKYLLNSELGDRPLLEDKKKSIFRICKNIKKAGFSPCYLKTLAKYQAQAYLILPLYQGVRLWGLLAAYQNSGPRDWKDSEIKFLAEVANCFSIAIEQDYLLQQTQKQKTELKIVVDQQIQQRIAELAKNTSKEKALAQVIDKIRQTLDLDTIFSTATGEIRQLLDADRVGIFQFKPHSHYYEGEFISEDVLEPYFSALKQPVMDRCFGDRYVTNYQQGQILVINDTEKANLSPCHFEILHRFQIRSNLVLPLTKNEELWGLLCIHQCSAPRQWQGEEIEFLLKITTQLGVALQQADLLIQTTKRSWELQQALEVLEEKKIQQEIIAQQEQTISQIITSIRQTLGVDSIFQITTQEIRQTLNCDRVVVYRFLPDWNGEFVYESSTSGWTPLIVANMKTVWRDTYFQETKGGRYANHESLAIEDIYTVGHTDCHIELLEMFQIRAYMVAPVFAGEQLWGLLAAYQNTGPRHWEEREVNLLARIGDQLGIAVQQAELLAQLQETTEKANASNHAKSQFLANMSHELRTPLNAILGFTQILDQDLSLNEQQQEYIGIIGRSGRHLLNLLNDVLEMSKIEAGKITLNENDFDLYNLLNTLEEMFILKAKSKKLQLSFQCNSNVPRYLKTDESKLRQVLINLVSNGIKFTESGYVILRINCLSQEHSIYTINFEVEDSGLGIHDHELNILFDPFFQSETGRKSQEGTGLGLPISQEFVKLMGGIITVKSTLNQGTIFSFQIPVSLSQENNFPSSLKKRIRGIKSNQTTYRILITDDQPESRLILKTMLSAIGFEIKEAENGQETIKIWEKWRPNLIWMDIRMPILGGLEATKIIRKKEVQPDNLAQENQVIIIALTASVFDTQRNILLQAGFNDFIAKPFREEVIFEKIAHYLNLEYLYEDESKVCLITDKENYRYEDDLTTQIKAMSANWITQLEQAVLGARENQIRQLITQIPAEYFSLKTTLLDLVDCLNFEEITHLIYIGYNVN
jgi:GAF domain-containing protein/DNA-binding response OmpR family regulator